jgi:hypothetical protein
MQWPPKRGYEMPTAQHTPSSHAPAVPIVRCARWIGRAARRPRVAETFSWLIWLLVVAAFAIWTHLHYRAPAGPAWLGMTIRTSVFAAWAQIAREWLMLRVHARQGRQSNHKPGDRQVHHD